MRRSSVKFKKKCFRNVLCKHVSVLYMKMCVCVRAHNRVHGNQYTCVGGHVCKCVYISEGVYVCVLGNL